MVQKPALKREVNMKQIVNTNSSILHQEFCLGATLVNKIVGSIFPCVGVSCLIFLERKHPKHSLKNAILLLKNSLITP